MHNFGHFFKPKFPKLTQSSVCPVSVDNFHSKNPEHANLGIAGVHTLYTLQIS